jgi:hypothetical protein
MSGNAQLSGELVVNPGIDAGSFPAGISNVPLSLLPCSKPFVVSTGDQVANVNNVSLAPVGGVGASGPVTNAHTLYLRTAAPMKVQLTLNNDGSGTTTETLNVNGTLLIETATGYEVQGVEVLGVGVLEYLAIGNS